MEQQSLLTEIEFTPVYAGSGKRFLNYLIGMVIFYIITALILAGFFYTGGNLDTDGFSADILFRLAGMLFFSIFYFLSELIFNGRTIGKFITGTKAVNEDGTQMQSQTILLRSLSRIVPFEPFSAFGDPSYPWHDKWTKTIVIDVRKTVLNEMAI